MGIVLKRRDNAPIVKHVYGGIIDILLNKLNLEGAVEFLKAQLQQITEGNVPLEQLIISKTLGGMYKDPSKIAHKVLARRMGERDAGNKPQVNDRIPFVFIKTAEEVKLQGDRIEHPDYIRQESLTPDYYYYITKQLMKPITQIFALCLEQLPGYSYPPNYWLQIDEELSGLKQYTDENKRQDRIQALKVREVEELLFNPYLNILCPEKQKTSRSKKKHVLDIITENDPIFAKHEYILSITNVSAKKRTKLYTIEIKLVDAETNAELFKENMDIKKKKLVAFIRATEAAFKKAYELPAVANGRLRIITEKVFITKWKSAHKNVDSLNEQFATIIKAGHTESFEELEELRSLINLIGFYDNVPYILDEPPETTTETV